MAARAERPRVRVAALITRSEISAQSGVEVLLVEHEKGHERYYLLPGGGVDFGETLEAALRREVAEECGLHVALGAPLLLSDTLSPAGDRHVINIVFAATIVGEETASPGQPAPPPDARVRGCVWTPIARLGQVPLHPPIADAVARAAASEPGSTRYLGALWTDSRERAEDPG